MFLWKKWNTWSQRLILEIPSIRGFNIFRQVSLWFWFIWVVGMIDIFLEKKNQRQALINQNYFSRQNWFMSGGYLRWLSVWVILFIIWTRGYNPFKTRFIKHAQILLSFLPFSFVHSSLTLILLMEILFY